MNIVFVEEREQIRPATESEKEHFNKTQDSQTQSSQEKDTELATELV